MAGEIAKDVAPPGIVVWCCRAKAPTAAANLTLSIGKKRLLKVLLKRGHRTRLTAKSPDEMMPRFGERIARLPPGWRRNFTAQPASPIRLARPPVAPKPIPAFQRKTAGDRKPGGVPTGPGQNRGKETRHQLCRNDPSLEQQRKQHGKSLAATPLAVAVGTENTVASLLPLRSLATIARQSTMKDQMARLRAGRTSPQFKFVVKGFQRRRTVEINRRRR